MTRNNRLGMTPARAGLMASLSILSVQPAAAYVDPGTGSMLVQMGIAAVAGAMFYFRQFRMAAVDWFRRKVLRQKQPVPAPDAQQSSDGPA